MATTTNYGWTTPDDTALVKDGAAAIRTLGTSIDTTTKNLNPSTTLGDIEYRSSSANVNTRLGIGTTGQVLTVASGVPSWVTPASGSSFVGCSLYMSGNQGIPNDSWTSIGFDVERFDTDGFHSNTINNSRITIPTGKSGRYLVVCQWTWQPDLGSQPETYLAVNNILSYYGPYLLPVSGKPTAYFGSYILNFNAGDYLEMKALHKSGASRNIQGTNEQTSFSIQFLGA